MTKHERPAPGGISFEKDWRELVEQYPVFAVGDKGLARCLPWPLIDKLAGRPGGSKSPALQKDAATAEHDFTSLCVRQGCSGVARGRPWRYTLLDPSLDVDRREEETVRHMILRGARGYAGQLLCSCEFFSQWERLKRKHAAQIRRVGYPLRRPALTGANLAGQGSPAPFSYDLWCLTTRWCLEGLAWDGLPEPVLPMRLLFASGGALAQYLDMGVFVLIPWYYKVQTGHPLPSARAIAAIQSRRDRNLAKLAKRHARRKPTTKSAAPPWSVFNKAYWAALMEDDDALRRLMEHTQERGSRKPFCDVLRGNPALQPGARLQRHADRYAKVFLYTCHGSELLRRYPKIKRSLLSKAFLAYLDASPRTLRRIRHELEPTRDARHRHGFVLP